MFLPPLLRAFFLIFIAGSIVCSIILCASGFMVGHRWFRLTFWLTPFACVLVGWAVYAGAARHDAHVEEALRATGAVASATVISVRDLDGVPFGQADLRESEEGAGAAGEDAVVNATSVYPPLR